MGGFLLWAAPFLVFRRPSPLPFAFPPLGFSLFACPRFHFGSRFSWLSLALLSTLPHFWCGFFDWFLPWAPLPCPSPSFLGCFLGDLSALYILHYMIHYECPIGFTAYRFLTWAAAWVSDPNWVTHLSCNKAAVLFTASYSLHETPSKIKIKISNTSHFFQILFPCLFPNPLCHLAPQTHFSCFCVDILCCTFVW